MQSVKEKIGKVINFFKRQFTLPIENLIKFLFERFLKTYVKNQSIDFNQFYKEGLKDMHLNECLLNEMFLQNSPFKIKQAVIDKVSSVINWQNLLDKSALILIDGITIHLTIDKFNQELFLQKKYQFMRENNLQGNNGSNQVIEEQDLEDSIKQSLKESLNSIKGNEPKSKNMYEQVDAYKVLVKKLLLGLKLSVSNINICLEISNQPNATPKKNSSQTDRSFVQFHVDSFQLQQFHDKKESKSFISQALFSNFELKAQGIQLYLSKNSSQLLNNIELNECAACCGHEYEYNAQLEQYIPKQQLRISLQKQNIQAIFPKLEIMLDSQQISILLNLIKQIQQYQTEELQMEQIYQNQQIQTEKISQASKIQPAPPRMRVYSFDYQEIVNKNNTKGKVLELKKRKSSLKSNMKKNIPKENKQSQNEGKKSSFSPNLLPNEQYTEIEKIEIQKQDTVNNSDGWSDIDIDIDIDEDEDENENESEQNGNDATNKLQREQNENEEENNDSNEDEEENVNDEKHIEQKQYQQTENANTPSQIIEDYFTQQFKQNLQEKIQNQLNNETLTKQQDIKEGIQNDDDLQISKDLYETLQLDDSQLSEFLESIQKNSGNDNKKQDQNQNQQIFGIGLENSILVKEEIKNQNIETITNIKQDSSHHFLLQSIHIYLIKSEQQKSNQTLKRKWIYSQNKGGEERMSSPVKQNIYMKSRSLFQINITGANIVQYKDDGKSFHLYFKKLKAFDLNWGCMKSINNNNFSDHYCINQVLKLATAIPKKQSTHKKVPEFGYCIYKNREGHIQNQSQSKICFNLLSNSQKQSILVEMALIYFNGDYKTLCDIKNIVQEIQLNPYEYENIYIDGQSRNKSSFTSSLYEVDPQNLKEQLKCGDYIKDEGFKNNENEQLKLTSSKISIQIENISGNYEIINQELQNELCSTKNLSQDDIQTQEYFYCSTKQNNQRLAKLPSLFFEIDQLKVIQTQNKYQINSIDCSVLLPFYSIQRNEICFNDLTISMLKYSEQNQLIKIEGDKNLSCDPFICIETVIKEYSSRVDASPTRLNHQESYASIQQDADYQNTPFNRMRQDSNLLLFSTFCDLQNKQYNQRNQKNVDGGIYFKKDDLYVFNVDENPIKDFQFKQEKDQSSQNSSQPSVSTQVLISIPNIQIDFKKDYIENLILLLLSLRQEISSINFYDKDVSSQNLLSKEDLKESDSKEFILNIYTNFLIVSYYTSEQDSINIEINSFQAQHDFCLQQFKCSIYDMIIVDTQQAKPLLGQPLRLVESIKITSKYRKYLVQNFILYKQGIYTQHQQFSLGKQPIRVSIQRILSTQNDDEKMNSSYYFPQRMIMIPKSHDKSENQGINSEDKYDLSDWIVKFKYDSINKEQSLSLFGCIFRLTDFTLPFFDEIQFLIENINDMINQIDSKKRKNDQPTSENMNNLKRKNSEQNQFDDKNDQQFVNNINFSIQNCAIDIFMFYNSNYLEKGGLSQMSYSQQVIDLELKKNNYYSNNRLCLLIPNCSLSIQQSITNDQIGGQFSNKNNKNNLSHLKNQQNKITIKVNGVLQQFSGYFLQFDDHNERLNSILLLDYSDSIVLMTEESILKQMNFKQIFNSHSIGLKAEISPSLSAVQIETKGIQILLCKDTLKYLTNFSHLFQYNLEILSESTNRRKKIGEQYIDQQQQKLNIQQQKQIKMRKSSQANQTPCFEIIEDEEEFNESHNDLNSSQKDYDKDYSQNNINESRKEENQSNRKQSIKLNKQSRRSNLSSSRGVFRTHQRFINTSEEEDIHILETEKTYFNYDFQDMKKQEQLNIESISFQFSLSVDDFYITIFKGLDFNYDVTCSLDNAYRDPLKRNTRQLNSSSIKNINNFNNNVNNQNISQVINKRSTSPQKQRQQKPSNKYNSLKQSPIFSIIENYQPNIQKLEVKKEEYRILQRDNIRDYKNRMQIVLNGANFKTEEYIQVNKNTNSPKQQKDLKNESNTNNDNKINNLQKKKKIYISIKQFEIIDDLKESSIKKFLTSKKTKANIEQQNNEQLQQSIINQLMSSNVPFTNPQGGLSSLISGRETIFNEIERETGIDFMTLEIDVLDETTDHIRIEGGLKIHPLQLYIHGIALDFLIDFFDLKNEIQKVLSGNNKKFKGQTLNKSASPKKRKSSTKKGNKNIQKINTQNEWEVLDMDDEDDNQNNTESQFGNVENYDHYESSGSSDEENKELIFDNNESLIQYYYQKNNINSGSPFRKGKGIFSGIDDINPFQLYKNKYSFETFDIKKNQNNNQQISQSQNKSVEFNKTCIEFTSTKNSKQIQQTENQKQIQQNNTSSTKLNSQPIKNNTQIDDNNDTKNKINNTNELKLNLHSNQQYIGQENIQNEINIKISLENQGEQEIQKQEKHINEHLNNEDEFDDELDNLSFSSTVTSQAQKQYYLFQLKIQQNQQIILRYRIEIDSFEIQETEVFIDYDPRAVDIFQLMNDFKMEAINLSSIKGINFLLPTIFITRKSFNNISHIIQIAMNTYQKDIIENQFSLLDIAQKVNLLNASKIFSIFTMPFQKYNAQETIVEGTLEGTKTVAKIISYQALDVSSSVLSAVNSTFTLFGIKSRPTRFLKQILGSIKKQVVENEEEIGNNEKYKNNSTQE